MHLSRKRRWRDKKKSHKSSTSSFFNWPFSNLDMLRKQFLPIPFLIWTAMFVSCVEVQECAVISSEASNETMKLTCISASKYSNTVTDMKWKCFWRCPQSKWLRKMASSNDLEKWPVQMSKDGLSSLENCPVQIKDEASWLQNCPVCISKDEVSWSWNCPVWISKDNVLWLQNFQFESQGWSFIL